MSTLSPIGILGAGPAGLSAALWLKNLGFSPWVAETQERSGGMQNLNFLANDWVLGQTGQTGPALARRFVDHARQAGVRLLCGVRPLRASGRAGRFAVELRNASGAVSTEACAALLIATGTRFRGAEVLAGVPGFGAVPATRFAFGPYAFADLAGCAGRRILIVGGGDNAFENARLLAPTAASVDLVLRSPPRAQQALREAVAAAEAAGRCRLHQPARIVALMEAGDVLAATLDNGERLTADAIHVLAGYEPNTAFLKETFGPADLSLDGAGYLRVDAAGRTSLPGVYAAGDVCNPVFPSVVSALAQGAHAAKTIEYDLRQP